MLESNHEVSNIQNPKSNYLILPYLASLISVSLTQSTLFLLISFIPPNSPFLALVPLSVLLIATVVGLGRICKKIAGVRASAPAFVFFSVFFVWAVYFCVVRHVISSFMEVVFNIEIIMVIIGLCSIMSIDPGFVKRHSSRHDPAYKITLDEVEDNGEVMQSLTVHGRVRYCKHCKDYVMGFDHHCPAFGNCIGQKNHALFLGLLVGFVVSETSYFACASNFLETSNDFGGKATTHRNLVLSTMLFSLIQVIWQVIFILWHIYCACFNIKTDEWINWKKYPEFQVEFIPEIGRPQTGTRFKNPYDKGIVRNLTDFVTGKG